MSKIIPKYLPLATDTTVGAIKVGSGLSIDVEGTLAALAGGSHNDLTGRDADDAHPISSVTGLSNALDLPISGLTGFLNQIDSTMSMSSSNFQIAPTGASYAVWSGGTKYVKTTTEQVAIANNNTLHFVYFNTSGVLTVSTTPWDVTTNVILVALVYRYGTTYKIYDERHSHNRNRDWHAWAHNTIGTRYQSGLSGTFTDTTFSIESGVVADEDIQASIPTSTACTLMYRGSGATYMAFEDNVATPYKQVSGALRYDNSGTLTAVTTDYYINQWVYGTSALSYPVAIVVGQSQNSTLQDAQGEDVPLFPGMPVREFKLLYRVTYQQTSGGIDYIEATDFREVSTGPGSSYTPTGHDTLSNRDIDNQHPSTALTVDTAGFSGNLSSADDTVQKAFDTIDNLSLPVVWVDLAGSSRTDSATLAGTGIETALPVGTHIRCYSGSAKPSAESDWKYCVVYATGTNSVSVFGEAIPTGGANLYVQKDGGSRALYTQRILIPGTWAVTASETDLIALYNRMPFEYERSNSRLIGACFVYSLKNDSGATQPTTNILVDGVDLLGSNYSVDLRSATKAGRLAANTGVITSGKALTGGSEIAVVCRGTGTKAESQDLNLSVYIALFS